MNRKNATPQMELTDSAMDTSPVDGAAFSAVLPGTAGPAERRDGAAAEGGQIAQRMDGIVIGRLVGLDGSNGALVDYPGSPGRKSLAALSTVSVARGDSGREVALAFQGGDPRKPVLMGFIQHPARAQSGAEEPEARSVEVERDGERLTLVAEREIVLRCGKASITLTRAGKVLIRGKYLLSRSSGVNRIKGGSVQIN